MAGPDSEQTRVSADQASRFLFVEADIRGEHSCLELAYQNLLDIHRYPSEVGRLLGEFLAASVLLSSNLKFEGKLVLQVRSEGQIPLLMVECDHELHVRGIARGVERVTSSDWSQLLADGQLAITVDPLRGQRYQGIVPLTGTNLATCLDGYFDASEQLKTRMWLAADGHRAAGLLLQQLPPGVATDESLREQQWADVCVITESVRIPELLSLDPASLLFRLYHDRSVRLYAPRQVKFRCSCSRERTLEALRTLDPQEIDDLLAECGEIAMDCEFCHQQYRFNRGDLAGPAPAPGLTTIH